MKKKPSFKKTFGQYVETIQKCTLFMVIVYLFSRVADLGGVDLDPDTTFNNLYYTFKKKTDLDPTL